MAVAGIAETTVPRTRARLLILGLVTIGTLINYLDRTVISVTAPLLSEDLDLTPALMGIALSAFDTGKAAMMLHGAWCYGSMATEGGDFVSGGNLGYMNFPGVDGGTGDPSDTVGNPGQYLSISSKASDAEKEIAKKFFATAVSSDAESKEWVASGGIPIVNGSDSLLSGKDEDWLKFQYGVASGAKTFTEGQVIFDIYKKDGDNLYLGRSSFFLDGDSADSRPVDLDNEHPLIKQ